MQTKDLIIYGAIIYLLYKITKQKGCNCNTMVPIVPVNFAPVETKAIIPLLPLANCLNCNFSNMDNSNLLDLPKFTKVNKQVQPTPASVLSPEQLAVYNASIKGISNKYIC
jgi:hypothetical protein